MSNKSTCAVVVTYNRLELLKECLGAIEEQSIPVSHIVVINNASNDGTRKYLDRKRNDKIIVVHSEKNMGGAGGFNKGIKTAFKETNDDYFWLMDDDTIVAPDCNENLLNKSELLNGQFGFLISNIRWIDGSPANVMLPSSDWPERVSEGLIKVDYGSFVSFFVTRENVHRVGLPITEFFIWGDDAEYSLRLRSINDGYFVSDARGTHKSATNKVAVGIAEDSNERIPRYYYYYRNQMYIWKHYFKPEYKKVFLSTLIKAPILGLKAKDKKIKRAKIVLRGLLEALKFNPKIEKP